MTKTEEIKKMKRLTKVTLPKLVEFFKQIGYKLEDRRCAYLLYDHQGNYTAWEFRNERLEKQGENNVVVFYYKDILVELLDKNCVSICAKNNKSVFINFSNYEK